MPLVFKCVQSAQNGNEEWKQKQQKITEQFNIKAVEQNEPIAKTTSYSLEISFSFQNLQWRVLVRFALQAEQDSRVLIAESVLEHATGCLLLSCELLANPIRGFRGHLRAQIAVERRRTSTLLHVTQNVRSRREDVLAFFTVQSRDEIGRIVLVAVFVSQNKTALHAFFHFRVHVLDVAHQVLDVERFFVDVRGVCAACKASQSGEITAVATHGFDHKHTALRALCRLANAITDFRNFVYSRVGAERKVGAGHVVRNRRGDNNQRDSQFLVFVAGIGELQKRVVGLIKRANQPPGDRMSFVCTSKPPMPIKALILCAFSCSTILSMFVHSVRRVPRLAPP